MDDDYLLGFSKDLQEAIINKKRKAQCKRVF